MEVARSAFEQFQHDLLSQRKYIIINEKNKEREVKKDKNK